MTRYDIYDQQLNPGDYICFVRHGELYTGKIQSIGMKGTISVCYWSDETKSFFPIARNLRTYRVIKIAGLPAQT